MTAVQGELLGLYGLHHAGITLAVITGLKMEEFEVQLLCIPFSINCLGIPSSVTANGPEWKSSRSYIQFSKGIAHKYWDFWNQATEIGTLNGGQLNKLMEWILSYAQDPKLQFYMPFSWWPIPPQIVAARSRAYKTSYIDKLTEYDNICETFAEKLIIKLGGLRVAWSQKHGDLKRTYIVLWGGPSPDKDLKKPSDPGVVAFYQKLLHRGAGELFKNNPLCKFSGCDWYIYAGPAGGDSYAHVKYRGMNSAYADMKVPAGWRRRGNKKRIFPFPSL